MTTVAALLLGRKTKERDPQQAQRDLARRLSRGSRTVLDAITEGSSVALAEDVIRVGQTYRRSFEVARWVQQVTPGWLADLITMEGVELDVSFFHEMLDPDVMREVYRVRLGDQITAGNIATDDGAMVALDTEDAIGDISRVRRALQDGEQQVFTSNLIVTVKADTLEKLGAWDTKQKAWTGDSGKVNSFFRLRGGALVLARWRQHDAFSSTLPIGMNLGQRHRTIDSRTAAYSLLPAVSSPSMDSGVEYGRSLYDGLPVLHNPFAPEMENANTLLLAPSGGGKSFLQKLLELRQAVEPIHVEGVGFVYPDVLVIDPENEQLRLAAALGSDAQVVPIRMGGDTFLNPFDVPGQSAEDDLEGASVFDDHISGTLLPLMQIMLVEKPGDVLHVDEVGALDQAIRDTYTHCAPSTPLLADLLFTLQHMPENADADRMATRLRQYVTGSYKGLFTKPTNVNLQRRFVIFATRDVPERLQPVVTQLITTYLWNVVRRVSKPRLLVVDEAGSILQYPEGGAFLNKLAMRARKYWLAVTFILQTIDQARRSPYGEGIIKNCATVIIKKQRESAAEAAAMFHLDRLQGAFIANCQRDEALLLTPFGRVEIVIEASPGEHQLATSNPAEVAAIEALERTRQLPPPSPAPAPRRRTTTRKGAPA